MSTSKRLQFGSRAMPRKTKKHLKPNGGGAVWTKQKNSATWPLSRTRIYCKLCDALYHPAGALEKKLLVKVETIMHTGEENAVIPEGSTLRVAIVEMSRKGLSMVTIVDQDQKLRGIIADGDLRRMLERGVDVYHEIVDKVMTKSPK